MKQFSNEIWVINDFWHTELCENIINDLELSKMFVQSNETDINNGTIEENLKSRNKNRIIYESEELAIEIWELLKRYLVNENLLINSIGINEMFRFYKYQVGQEFKRHTDSSFIRNDAEKSSHSLLIYLNDDFEGGITTFDECKLNPVKGSAVFFPHDLEHSSTTITNGVKYILRSDIICREVI